MPGLFYLVAFLLLMGRVMKADGATCHFSVDTSLCCRMLDPSIDHVLSAMGECTYNRTCDLCLTQAPHEALAAENLAALKSFINGMDRFGCWSGNIASSPGVDITPLTSRKIFVDHNQCVNNCLLVPSLICPSLPSSPAVCSNTLLHLTLALVILLICFAIGYGVYVRCTSKKRDQLEDGLLDSINH
ncbi:MAG: hypothetical protein JKY23_00375 [Nitrospinaceae bacterium]|nr:hypothetical protein [Nitrospinaceae bacterium]